MPTFYTYHVLTLFKHSNIKELQTQLLNFGQGGTLSPNVAVRTLARAATFRAGVFYCQQTRPLILVEIIIDTDSSVDEFPANIINNN